MKILKSLSNFIWLYIIIGIIVVMLFIFPSEPTPSGRFIYDVIGYAIALISTCVLGYLSSKVYEWIETKKRAKQQR